MEVQLFATTPIQPDAMFCTQHTQFLISWASRFLQSSDKGVCCVHPNDPLS